MIGKRLQRARKALGLSLRDLADRVDLSHTAIKKYEDNEVTPSSPMLIKLAKALKVRAGYFFRPERVMLGNIQYRAHADIPSKHLEEIEAKILDKIERRIELESLFPTPPAQPFSINATHCQISDENSLEDCAEKIREKWSLGMEPISDLIDVFEENGIKVFEIDNQQHPKFDGLCATINGMPIIVIGNRWPGDRQRFTLAHELGHLILGGEKFPPELNEENCCNRFAGAFLIPRKTLLTMLGKHRNNIEPRELSILKQEFGISMSEILHRALEIGIISPPLYRQLRSDFDERGWSKTEPGEQYPQQKTHIFEQMIFHALAEEYIGESKAAELMNISLESFRSLRAIECQHVSNHQ